MSRHQNAGQNCNLKKTSDTSFENGMKFKYMGPIVIYYFQYSRKPVSRVYFS